MIYFYVKVLGDITKMRFQLYILHLCFFVLVVLTYLSQGQLTTTTTTTEEPATFLQKMHEAFKKVRENAKISNFHFFDPSTWMPTTTTTEKNPEELTESFDITNRQLITVPVRCPPNFDFIKGRCREKIL